MRKFSLVFLLLISAPLSATDANWISTSNSNMATAANWNTGSVPTGSTATFNSSSPSGVVTSLAWDPDNATPSFPYPQFSLNAFNFATTESAAAFSFGFITTSGDAYGLVFTGAGITGQSTNTTFTFNNTGIAGHQHFPQLQFSPNGTSSIGEADIAATNAGTLQNPPGSSLRKSNPQVLLDGSSNGDSVSAAANQCIITSENNSINLTNASDGLIAGFSATGIDGVSGQFIIGGSSNGTGDSNSGAGASALASLTVHGATIFLTNNGEIESDNSTDISGGAGQWIVDGSSNGLAINYSGSGGVGNASFTASNSTFFLNNNFQLISSFSDFTVGAEGQLVIKGNSTGVGRSVGTGTGGTGTAAFAITNSALTIANQGAGSISGTSISDISGAVGQLVLDGTSNGFGSATTGIGENGNSSFSASSSTLSLTNNGQLIGGQSNIAGGVGQIVVDGSSNSNANTGAAASGNGNALFALNSSFLTLANTNSITTSSFTPDNIIGAAAQLVVDGTCNSSNVGSNSGSGHASLAMDNSTILIENYGSITSLQDGTLAAQVVFDGSANEQNSSPLGSGLAVLNAGNNAVISVINEASGSIAATGSVAAQVYFHNASISGAPLINVTNLNPAASIEGIVFDQNSNGGSAVISLTNSSFVVDTTSSALPFSIGGLSGNSSSMVKLQTNDLQISTALGAIHSFEGNIIGSGKNLFIAGQGKQVLNGNNTYTGSTTVSSGTLAVNGTLSSTMTVSSGATLKGTGTIYALTKIAGTLSPGNSIGIMHYQAPLIITGNLSIEIAPIAGVNSQISSSSTVDLTGATIEIIPDPGTYTVGSQYILLTSAGLTGTPSLSMPAQFRGELSFPNNSIVLTLLRVPQPAPPLRLILPPADLKGKQIKKKCDKDSKIFNVLKWNPPLFGIRPTVYKIYRSSLKNLIGEVSAHGKLKFKDKLHHINKAVYTYYVVSQNGDRRSIPAKIEIKSKEKRVHFCSSSSD